MTDLEFKKARSELLRVQSAKAEMEYIIAERMVEIRRLEDNIKKQEAAEQAILLKLEGQGK